MIDRSSVHRPQGQAMPECLVSCLQGVWLQLQSFLRIHTATDTRADLSTQRLQRECQERLVRLEGRRGLGE